MGGSAFIPRTCWRRCKAQEAASGLPPLAFPWDAELGQPQAQFTIEAGRWYLEGLEDAPHGTYRINREERLTGEKVQLENGDILKASNTWLVVR